MTKQGSGYFYLVRGLCSNVHCLCNAQMMRLVQSRWHKFCNGKGQISPYPHTRFLKGGVFGGSRVGEGQDGEEEGCRNSQAVHKPHHMIHVHTNRLEAWFRFQPLTGGERKCHASTSSSSSSYAGIGNAAAATASERQESGEDGDDTRADLMHKSQQRRVQKLTKQKLRGKSPMLVNGMVNTKQYEWTGSTGGFA